MDKPGAATITLQEALDAFNQKNSANFADRELTAASAEFFRCHDVAHVVFDCDTTLYGEGVVKLWTLFGTTLGLWQHLTGYKEVNAFSLFRMYSWRHISNNILRLLVDIPRVVIRARSMTKLWPWSEFETYLDKPIEDIRRQFNIKPIAID